MTRRYWDGYVRNVVSFRRVNIGVACAKVRVETLTCGHEQAFAGSSVGSPSVGARVCRQCEDAGNVIPFEPQGAHTRRDSNEPRNTPTPPHGRRATGGVR